MVWNSGDTGDGQINQNSAEQGVSPSDELIQLDSQRFMAYFASPLVYFSPSAF